MSKLLSALVAALFAVATVTPAAYAQDQKKEQAQKGTPDQGGFQKKAQEDTKKKDVTGGEMKKGEGKKAEGKAKGEGKGKGEAKSEGKGKAETKAEPKKDEKK